MMTKEELPKYLSVVYNQPEGISKGTEEDQSLDSMWKGTEEDESFETTRGKTSGTAKFVICTIIAFLLISLVGHPKLENPLTIILEFILGCKFSDGLEESQLQEDGKYFV
jgi:hypothetical protein